MFFLFVFFRTIQILRHRTPEAVRTPQVGKKSARRFARVNKAAPFDLCDTRLSPLDGAKKPWDRANSADRSMVSR